MIREFIGFNRWGKLKELNLEKNFLKEIPTEIENLVNLEVLNLDSNKIQIIP